MPIFEKIIYFLFIIDFNQSSGSGQQQPVDDVSMYRYMDKRLKMSHNRVSLDKHFTEWKKKHACLLQACQQNSLLPAVTVTSSVE